MFRINGTVHPLVGQEMSFQCRLSAGNEIEKDRCEFEAPNGQTFFTNPDNGRVDVLKLIYADSDRPKPTFKPKPKYRHFGLI